MLSDLNCSALPFDIPTVPDHSTPHTEEDPLDFDDLLDIAREFEFTRTITHIWPCEEEPSTCPETGLDGIFAAIVPTPKVEECPMPLLSSAPSMTLGHVHVQEVGLQRSCASISTGPVPLRKGDDQVAPITSTLRGWSPPNGSQFLDLNDSLMLPQSTKDMWIPPWLTMFLAPSSTQPVGDLSKSLVTVSAMGDVQPQTLATVPKPPPVSTTDKTVGNPRKKRVPSVPLPVKPSTRAILEPVRARFAAQTNSNVPSQTAMTPHAKTPKARPHLPSTSAAGGTSTTNYARAPRGGIPPHIARSVTKANILRVEKERKVMQDTFSSTTTGEAKKPSVLRRVAKVEREMSKSVNGGGSGKKLFDWGETDEKEGRAAKRARV
jgi:hypothetical protein